MIRLATIVGLGLFAILVGAGCKSLSGSLEIDTPFIDIEYEGRE